MSQFADDPTALYRLYDADDTLLYVGITATPKKRFTEHAADKPWWPQVARRDVSWVNSRDQALIDERQAIVAEQPLHNSQHALPILTDGTASVFAKYKHDYEMEQRLRGPMQEMADRELKAGATVGQLSKLTGLTPEVFRRRARRLGIELKRPPTVGKLAAPSVTHPQGSEAWVAEKMAGSADATEES